MKPILIDKIQSEFADTIASAHIRDGNIIHIIWPIAKPLNYDPDYFSMKDRQSMADAILEGKAIAVCFFEDLSDEDKLEYARLLQKRNK